MKVTKNLGGLLLGAWLIATGLLPFLNVGIPGSGTALALLALIAGIFIVFGR